jgi:8-amino-7-oxononanoate synthase
MTLNPYLHAAIEQHKQQHLYRQRLCHDGAQTVQLHIDGKTYLNFSSNDYLGLASQPQLIAQAQQALSQYGLGAGAAHLVTGHQRPHHDLEQRLATFTQRQQSLLFSTGYMANLGVISALINRHDALFMDKLNHASLLDAALLSRAQVHRYRHRDVSHLAQLLAHSTARHKLIATDGVFSMEGDVAPLADIAALAKQHDAWLMVDDAHGLGVLGNKGGGSLAHFELSTVDVPILMGTLGKAFGGFGAFIAGDGLLIDYLIQRARPYIYTTAMPAAMASALIMAVDWVEQADDRRAHLHQLIQSFQQLANQKRLPILASDTPIQAVMVKQADKAVALSRRLFQQGILVTAIRSPTVPHNSARLRITLSAHHQLSDVERLIGALTA